MKSVDKLRPKPGTILFEDDAVITTVTSVKETDDYLVIYSKSHYKTPGEFGDWKHSEKHQKFLCVNGPLEGKKLVPEEAPEYTIYNRAYRGWNQTKKSPKVVLVYA